MTLMVCLQHVTKEFSAGKQTVRAVDDVSLEIERGEIFGVIGYSGAGKSTLVRLINALESPTSGTVIIDGETITGKTERQLRPVRARTGFIFQQFNLLGSRTVAGNVAYPLRVARWSKGCRVARVVELLVFVGLADKALHFPVQISGA
ncbi:MAG: ATP-binding cassette domain-containing protein, partial [Cellulomonas sp.]|nr:ATP-binding cassette domain-containing protein [Cellulomonas sp.]